MLILTLHDDIDVCEPVVSVPCYSDSCDEETTNGCVYIRNPEPAPEFFYCHCIQDHVPDPEDSTRCVPFPFQTELSRPRD